MFRAMSHETTKVPDQAIVALFVVFDQQQIDMLDLDLLCAVERHYTIGSIVAKDIDGKVVLLLQLIDVADWCWELYPSDIDLVFIGLIVCNPLWMDCNWVKLCKN